VAGTFYPADETTLRGTVERLLLDAAAVGGDGPEVGGRRAAPGDGPAPKGVVVPHAGYVYSGPFAARAYAVVAPRAAEISRVVLIGPAHRVLLVGMAVPAADAFQTPLGPVPVDPELRERVASLDDVVVADGPHADEHSLEVQLPFLQTVLPSFSCLPIAVGRASNEAVRTVLDAVWGGRETLVVVSTDLSHYLTDADAREIDARTVAAIEGRQPDLDGRQACGARALAGLLTLARERHLTVTNLAWGNSSDTAGDDRRVVGYAAFRIDEPDPARPGAAVDVQRASAGRAASAVEEAVEGEHDLVALARASIEHGLTTGRPLAVDAARLVGRSAARGGSFVTLRTDDGALRGCVGTVEPEHPLAVDVARNAWRAAFGDPRFTPLTAGEWSYVAVSVAVLSPLEPLPAGSRGDLVQALRPGEDGLVVATARGRATFLPAVWEQLPEAAEFVDRLWQKAGLAPGAWPADLQLWRYVTRSVP
jgi:AmmeMemoRadiSam system protein B/AmmeMemoRadiSam system protein A